MRLGTRARTSFSITKVHTILKASCTSARSYCDSGTPSSVGVWICVFVQGHRRRVNKEAGRSHAWLEKAIATPTGQTMHTSHLCCGGMTVLISQKKGRQGDEEGIGTGGFWEIMRR
jgi:hypothetical protein